MEAAASKHEVLTAGPLAIQPAEYSVWVDHRRLPLTTRELQLLTALARRGGRIVSREELYAVVWGRPFHSEERSVDVYVRKLRTKLARELPQWRFIHTHFGFGYRLAPECLSQVFHTEATDR